MYAIDAWCMLDVCIFHVIDVSIDGIEWGYLCSQIILHWSELWTNTIDYEMNI